MEARFFDKRVDIRYWGLPYGILLRLSLWLLSARIGRIIKNKNINVDHVIAHKFSVEGGVAFFLKRKFGFSYSCALWGGTDRRIISKKFELRNFYRKVLIESECIMPASPWINNYIENKLGFVHANSFYLPILTLNTTYNSSIYVDLKFVSVFNLDLYELKGLPNLLRALSDIGVGNFVLDIYGVGSELSVLKIKKLVSRLGLENNVYLKGRIDNSRITEVLCDYSAFLMPTTNETYGMVYIEALFSGLPILYSQFQGVDGYFDNVNVGVRVNPRDVMSIRYGIDRLISDQRVMKDNIDFLHKSGFFKRFSADSVVTVFDERFCNAGTKKDNIRPR